MQNENVNRTSPVGRKPGAQSRAPKAQSRAAVLILLGEAFLEFLKLPFRVVLFLINKRRVSQSLRKMLSGSVHSATNEKP